MSFSGLFAVGVSGVAAHATSLEAISNNIANSQTVGYRQARTDFAQLVAHAGSSGDTVQPGQGVDATIRVSQNEQGLISRTANTTNLAISGRGFFVVNDPTQTGQNGTGTPLFTRAGDFTIKDAGNLVNGSGQILLGSPVNSADTLDAGTLGSLSVIDLSGFTGAGAATDSVSLVGALRQNGAINPLATNYAAADPARNIAGGTVVPDLRQTISIFDTAGNPSLLNIGLVRLSETTVGIEIFTQDSDTPLANGTLTFDEDGRIAADVSTLPARVDVEGTDIALDLSSLNLSVNGSPLQLNQTGGAAFGAVTGYEIDQQGVLRATLNNGLTPALFQIPLALFTNAEGLTREADTAFRFDPAAGSVDLVVAGRDGSGVIEASAIENSTVDITQSFSALIETQRAYAANAQILSVTDELYETLNDTAA